MTHTISILNRPVVCHCFISRRKPTSSNANFFHCMGGERNHIKSIQCTQVACSSWLMHRSISHIHMHAAGTQYSLSHTSHSCCIHTYLCMVSTRYRATFTLRAHAFTPSYQYSLHPQKNASLASEGKLAKILGNKLVEVLNVPLASYPLQVRNHSFFHAHANECMTEKMNGMCA